MANRKYKNIKQKKRKKAKKELQEWQRVYSKFKDGTGWRAYCKYLAERNVERLKEEIRKL